MLRWVTRGVKLLGAGLICYNYVGFPNKVLGPGLRPTLSESDEGVWVLAEALPGLVDRVQPGDIVVCWSANDPHSHITSRLRALPGQSVQLQLQQGQKKPTIIQVPAGHMMLQGDHPDSPQHGPIPLALLQGRVVAEIWPTLKKLEPPAGYTTKQP